MSDVVAIISMVTILPTINKETVTMSSTITTFFVMKTTIFSCNDGWASGLTILLRNGNASYNAECEIYCRMSCFTQIWLADFECFGLAHQLVNIFRPAIGCQLSCAIFMKQI